MSEETVYVVYEGYLAEIYVPGAGGFVRGKHQPVPKAVGDRLLSVKEVGFKRGSKATAEKQAAEAEKDAAAKTVTEAKSETDAPSTSEAKEANE